MIRPRKGDFVYSEEELQMMEEDIRIAGGLGAKSLVFGCLRYVQPWRPNFILEARDYPWP